MSCQYEWKPSAGCAYSSAIRVLQHLLAGLELVSLISVTGNFIWLIVWLIVCDGTVTWLIELADRKWMIGKPKV